MTEPRILLLADTPDVSDRDKDALAILLCNIVD